MMILEDSASDDLTELFDDEGTFSIADSDNSVRIINKFKKHLSVNSIPVDTEDAYFSGDICIQ